MEIIDKVYLLIVNMIYIHLGLRFYLVNMLQSYKGIVFFVSRTTIFC